MAAASVAFSAQETSVGQAHRPMTTVIFSFIYLVVLRNSGGEVGEKRLGIRNREIEFVAPISKRISSRMDTPQKRGSEGERGDSRVGKLPIPLRMGYHGGMVQK